MGRPKGRSFRDDWPEAALALKNFRCPAFLAWGRFLERGVADRRDPDRWRLLGTMERVASALGAIWDHGYLMR